MSKINESEKEEKKRQKINAQTRIKRNALKSCCTTTSASSFFFLDFYLRAGRRAIIRCPSQGGQRSKRSRRRRRRWRISRKTGPRDRVQGNLFKLLITRAPRGDKCGGGKIFQRRETHWLYTSSLQAYKVSRMYKGEGRIKKLFKGDPFHRYGSPV